MFACWERWKTMTDGEFVVGQGRMTNVISDDGTNSKQSSDRIEDTFDSAFVAPDQRVLDPTLLTKTLLERIPTPSGWRILIMPYQGRAVTSGGIFVPDKTREDYALATVVGYVLKVGPLCYTDKAKFGEIPWCREKDWIMIGRYSGSRFRIDGGELRIINDDEVLGVIIDPDDVQSI